MSSALNQLGILLSGRRPGGFAGARTPGFNPNQPYPYPTPGQPYPYPAGGTGSPAEQDPNQPKPAEEDKPFLRSIYDGLVKNPMGPAFTLAMANSLVAPLRPGQTEAGKWIESVTQGYNSLGALAQLRAQQAQMQRKEGLEDVKLGQEQEKIQTEQQRVFNQQGQAESKQTLEENKAAETARSNKAKEEQSAKDLAMKAKDAETRAKLAERRFDFEVKKAESELKLKSDELKLEGQKAGQTAKYQDRMSTAALRQAAAASVRASAVAEAVKNGYKPEQVALMERLANDEAEMLSNSEMLGGDPAAVRKSKEEALVRIRQRFDAATGKGAPGTGGNQPAVVKWGKDAQGNPVRMK